MVNIKTSKHTLPNKQFKVYVCLEYDKDLAEMAADIAKGVEQRISDEDKLKMTFEFEEYRKQVEAKLEQMRNSK
jgi:uncharacterized alkaline shock family protein YloU